MGKEHEAGCAECFKRYLRDNGHVACYEHEPRGRDTAPDYIFTIDDEGYSVEVTEFKADDFHYLADRHGARAICKQMENMVQEIRENSGHQPQTGCYYLDMILPLRPKKKMEKEMNRVAEVIASAESPRDAEEIETDSTVWYVGCAREDETLIILPGLTSSDRKGESWSNALSDTAISLVKILRDKKGKIEKNEPHMPKIFLLFGVGEVRMKVASAWKACECLELKNAARNFDCILLIWQDKGGEYGIDEVLIPFNPRN